MATKPTRSQADQELAQLILKKDLLTKADLHDAFVAQETMAKVGITKPLAEVIIDKKVLPRREVEKLLGELTGETSRGMRRELRRLGTPM